MYKKYSNNDEFFYDASFDDYEKYYLLKYSEADTQNIHIHKELYILLDKPTGVDIDITKIVGTFYPKKDILGIYGNFKIFNTLDETSFVQLLEFCKLHPWGICRYNNRQQMDYFSIQHTYLA